MVEGEEGQEEEEYLFQRVMSSQNETEQNNSNGSNN